MMMICISIFNCISLSKRTYLSGIYTVVCAYRSIFPKVDMERVVLYDNILSSIFVGRSLATIAEIAFAIQVSQHVNNIMIVPPIILAQCFCWTSVLTLNPLWHIMEESVWALTAFIALDKNNFMVVIPYILFMVLIDIPMYIRKYKAWDGRYLHFKEGIKNALYVRYKITQWDFWKNEAMWMTPYFSVAVWISQYM